MDQTYKIDSKFIVYNYVKLERYFCGKITNYKF